MNIFNIQAKYAAIAAELDNLDGELTPELEKELAINEQERDDKMEAYAYIIKESEANSVIIKDEIARLNKLVKSNTSKVQRLKNTIMDALELFGLYGKSGNLSHKLPYHSLFTCKTVAVNLLVDKIDVNSDIVNDEPGLFKFKLNNFITFKQVKELQKLFNSPNSSFSELEDIDFNVELNKADFKLRIAELESIVHEFDVSEEVDTDSYNAVMYKLNLLNELATIVKKQSLTIR